MCTICDAHGASYGSDTYWAALLSPADVLKIQSLTDELTARIALPRAAADGLLFAVATDGDAIVVESGIAANTVRAHLCTFPPAARSAAWSALKADAARMASLSPSKAAALAR